MYRIKIMSNYDQEYNHTSAHQHFELALRKLQEFEINTESLDYYEMNQEKWDSLIHEAKKNGATDNDLKIIRMMTEEEA